MRRKTAIVYARVSTARQASDELPIDSQIEQCIAKASELGADVLRVFTDPGISGRDEFRPGFQEAIAYCEENGVDVFVTWSTSRFARNHIVAGIYKRRLTKKGVQLAYCTVDIDRDTPGGMVLDGMLALIDEHMSNQIAQDTMRSMLKNAADGFFNGGRIPFGYRSSPSPKNQRRRILVPCPEEAWLVGEIFKWGAEGLGCRLIAGRLNDSAYTHRGRRWSASTVAALLRNSTVTGKITFNRIDRETGLEKNRDVWVQVQSHEPIIEPELWERVQMRIDKEKPMATGSPQSTFLFTGLAKCAFCGGGMQMETAKGRSKRYSYYNCSTWLRTKQCRTHRRPAREMDAWLLDTIVEKVFTKQTLAEVARELNTECGKWAVQRREKTRVIEAQLADIAKRKSRLFEILELQGRAAPNLGDLSDRLQSLNSQARALTAQLADIDAQPMPAFGASDAEIEAIGTMLRSLVADASDVKRTRALLQNLLESVVLDSDRVEIVYKTALLTENGRQRVSVHTAEKWLPVQSVLGTRRIGFALPEKLRLRRGSRKSTALPLPALRRAV